MKKSELSIIRNGITKLTAAARVAELCETVAFGNGRRSSIRVGFFVVVTWEVIEYLKSICSIRVKGDAIFAGGVKTLEGVDGGFVVMLVGRVMVGSKKCKTRRAVWTCTGGQPVNGTNNTLVNVGAAFEF